MSTVQRFEDLEIWKMARALVKEVYDVTKKKEFAKDFGFKDQIRRSSLGVMNNISEGFEQRTVKIFIDYLGRAKGSCGETRSMLYVALDCNYISKEQFEKMYNTCLIISKKTRKLMSYLENYDSNNRIEETIIKYNRS